MKNKNIIFLIILSITILFISGCSKKIDNSQANINSFNFIIKIDDTVEEFVINRNSTYKRKLKDNKEIEKEFYFWDEVKVNTISNDLKEAGLFEIDGFNKKNTAVKNGINFTMKAKLSNGNTISAQGQCATPNNYNEIVKVIKKHFD